MNNSMFFWTFSVFLFAWGAAYLGLVVFSFFVSTPEHWAGLVADGRIKSEYAAYIAAIPKWVIVLTTFAALTRFFGGAALLLQSSWALPLYSASLVLVAVIMFRGFVIANVISVIRPSQVFLEIAFLAISVFAVWFSRAQMGYEKLS